MTSKPIANAKAGKKGKKKKMSLNDLKSEIKTDVHTVELETLLGGSAPTRSVASVRMRRPPASYATGRTRSSRSRRRRRSSSCSQHVPGLRPAHVDRRLSLLLSFVSS